MFLVGVLRGSLDSVCTEALGLRLACELAGCLALRFLDRRLDWAPPSLFPVLDLQREVASLTERLD